MEKDISLLSGIALFKGLSEEKIRKVLNIMHQVIFSENEIIMKEGNSGDAMYIILDGSVEVVKSLVIFTRLDGKHNHAVFGEIALLEELKRTATIKAITNCVLYEIKKDDFLKLAESDYELGYRILLNLARVVSARLRKADEETVKLTTALSIVLRET